MAPGGVLLIKSFADLIPPDNRQVIVEVEEDGKEQHQQEQQVCEDSVNLKDAKVF